MKKYYIVYVNEKIGKRDLMEVKADSHKIAEKVMRNNGYRIWKTFSVEGIKKLQTFSTEKLFKIYGHLPVPILEKLMGMKM